MDQPTLQEITQGIRSPEVHTRSASTLSGVTSRRERTRKGGEGVRVEEADSRDG